MKERKRLITAAIAFGIGAAVFLGICFYRDVFHAADTQTLFKYLSDAAFVPGGLMLCVGALAFCGNHGAFDGIGYGFKVSLHTLIPLTKYPGKYADYIAKKHEKSVRFAEFFIVGGIYLLLALVFTLVYEAV